MARSLRIKFALMGGLFVALLVMSLVLSSFYKATARVKTLIIPPDVVTCNTDQDCGVTATCHRPYREVVVCVDKRSHGVGPPNAACWPLSSLPRRQGRMRRFQALTVTSSRSSCRS